MVTCREFWTSLFIYFLLKTNAESPFSNITVLSSLVCMFTSHCRNVLKMYTFNQECIQLVTRVADPTLCVMSENFLLSYNVLKCVFSKQFLIFFLTNRMKILPYSVHLVAHWIARLTSNQGIPGSNLTFLENFLWKKKNNPRFSQLLRSLDS